MYSIEKVLNFTIIMNEKIYFSKQLHFIMVNCKLLSCFDDKNISLMNFLGVRKINFKNVK